MGSRIFRRIAKNPVVAVSFPAVVSHNGLEPARCSQ